MKKLIISGIVGVLMILVGAWMVFAQDYTKPLCHTSTCPDCIVTCPEMPNVTLNCSATSSVLPGLWEVRFKGSKKCGTVTIYSDQLIIEDQNKGLTWLLVDKKLIMEQVESCQ